ncbi:MULTISPECIES: alpha/beta fold hydrolase [Sphingobacterium]|uniref:alpha/beta fold hydrolase n=1 Tax=Sphingobacterium TaxID=28453 RepID=UPI0013DCDF27|nr:MULTISPECIES: alpha/beta hydrolase [unclassified Sphingobacterium]
MLKRTTKYIDISNSDNSVTPNGLYSIYIEPLEKAIVASILILHGMQEHSGRYLEFAEYLGNLGFAVLLYDHVGHGNTAVHANAQGYFQKEQPQDRLISDAIGVHRHLKNMHPELPHFIIGHSMGSFITRNVLQRVGSEFDGSVWIGTGAKTPGAEIFKSLLSLLNKLNPKKRSKLINGIFSKINNSKFQNEADFDDTSWLSLSKSNRRLFKQDSRCGIPFTNNAFYTLLTLLLQATKKGWYTNIPTNLPILLVSGENDPIGDFSKGINHTERQLKAAGFKDISTQIYAEKRHEILQEDNKEQVFSDIGQWLLAHVQSVNVQ